MAALSGADPLVVAGLTADASRLDAARRLGATRTVDVQTENLEEIVRSHSALGADLVCDASGASRPLELALRLARPDGQVTKVGWSPDAAATDVNPLVQRNLRLQGSFSHNYPVWERVIDLLDRRVTMAETIVGLRTPLENWREAFDAMHEGRVIKSVLVPAASTGPVSSHWPMSIGPWLRHGFGMVRSARRATRWTRSTESFRLTCVTTR